MRVYIWLIMVFFFAGVGYAQVNDIGTLRAAVEDLSETFGSKYPNGREYLERLSKIKNPQSKEFKDLQKEALIANPLVSGHPILYVSRTQYPKGHHNTETMFQSDEHNCRKFTRNYGGSLKSVDLAAGGKVTTVVDAGKTGCARDPELSFDGKKIVFSMRKSLEDDYHIYEVNSDGKSLKQLTSRRACFDIDPLYLPDGGIVFSSSREPKYCMCNIHIMANLFRMDGDGANIHQIGKSTLFEGHSSLMPDGRIMYDRWEYVDRNFGDAQGLWAVNPDGTVHSVYWGNNTTSPGGVVDARIIPGTQLCIATLTSCHDRPWGAIGIIDRRLGVDGKEPVIKTWPASARNWIRTKGQGFDTFKRVKSKYEDPYPLSENCFLVSRRVDNGHNMGIFLIDMFGNEVLLHQEAKFGCFDPMPIAPRFKPAGIPVMRDYKNGNGKFYVQDVYIGTHMKGIERGEVKYLRIVESPPKRNWTYPSWHGQGVHRPAMNWHNFENKRILGTVPVEEDGSAYFECPSDKFIFFQLLDKNKMMVQSMRSGTMIQSGETQGCIGCHENRVKDAPPVTKQLLALKREPSELDGWYGEARIFSFQKEVQPVFNKHCVECHDYGKPAGRKLNLAEDRTLSFNASYIDLWAGKAMNCIGAGPAEIQQPKTWGSHASKIAKVIREGNAKHKDLKLNEEELARIITWIDINAPYYPTYDSAYPDSVCGRSPLDRKEHKRLAKLTGAPFVKGHGSKRKAQVSFERPELSPCLTNLKRGSPKYNEALTIIKTGAERLKKTPRADMAGFKPCKKDTERNAKYERYRRIEDKFRAAIDAGKKLYDKDCQMIQPE